MNHAESIHPLELKRLAEQISGPVVTPQNEQYIDETFAWNLAYPQTAAVAVGATSAADVQAAVRFAAAHDLPVSVLATGHGSLGTPEQALLINVRRLNTLVIDEEARTATVGAGVEWQDVVAEAGKVGLAPLSGSAVNVGVVGYTVGGGLSPVLGRQYGWAADHVISFDLVTPDGELRTVSATTEPDLFWAVRGGKSNFGVVTSLTFALVPVSRFYGGGIYFAAEHADAVLSEFRRLASVPDDGLTVSFAFLRMPPLPFVPEPLRGRTSAHLRFSYLGTAEVGEALVAPLRAVAPALMDVVQERSYAEYAAVHSDPVDPVPAYERTSLLADFPKAAADALIGAAGADVQTPAAVVEVRQLGGALSREGHVPSAVSHRDAAFSLWVGAMAAPGQEATVSAPMEAVVDALKPWHHPGAALNFMGSAIADPEQLRTAYSAETFERLVRIKQKYDPRNIFRAGGALPAA